MVLRFRLPFERRIETYLARLAPTTRAALWMLLGGFCAVMMNVLIRLAAERMHPFEVTFFRCLFSLGFMLPFIVRDAGHSAMEPGIREQLVLASERAKAW